MNLRPHTSVFIFTHQKPPMRAVHGTSIEINVNNTGQARDVWIELRVKNTGQAHS